MQDPAPDPADIEDRKMADAALNLSEIRYRRLFEAAHDGILILDPDTRKIVDANPFMTTLIGYPNEQLIGLELYEIGFLADAQASRDMFQKLKATRQVRYENLPLQSQHGELRDVEVVANLYDEGGHSVVQCNVRDITERKAAETALREREDELSRAHRIAGMGSFKLEVRDGNFVADRSPEYLAVHGLTPQDRGSSHEAWLRRLHPGDRQKADQTFRECLADGRKLYQSEYRIIRQNDGATRWIKVLAEIERDAAGAPLRLFGTHLDVTESRLHEAALRKSEIRYRRLFEAAHDGVLILDPDTRKIVDANPFMTTLIGYSYEQLIGLELFEIGFLADVQASQDMFEKLKVARQVRYEDLPLRNQQGGLRDVEVVANLYDEGGHSVVQCNVRDITERKRIETTLREHQNFLNRIFEVLPGFLYIFDLDTNSTVFANNPADGTYSSEEIVGMGADVLPNLMHPDDHQGLQEHIARVQTLSNGATATFEYRMRDKADEWRWYLSTNTVFLRDEGGVVRQFIGVASEITERKQAEAALSEGARQQSFLLELSDALRAEPSAEAVANRALRMLFDQMRLDRCYVGIYRLAEDIAEFPHQVHDDRLPPLPPQVRLSDFPQALQVVSDRTLVIDDIVRMDGFSDSERASFAGLGMGALIVATLRKGENNPLWALVAVSASPRVWTPGEVSLVEEVAERIWAAMERARAEERLQTAHDTFRSLVDRSPFGTYIINSNFCLVHISKGGEKTFGNVRPLIGRDLAEVVHIILPDPFASEVIAHFRHTLATGEPFTAETSERRADINATGAYDWKIERVILQDGRFGVVCHFYDLSERIRHEEHVRLLMSEVNHRSKNLLAVVQAIARRTMATQPENFIERFGERVQALVANQDLLVKSEWEAVSLGELVRSQLAHFGAALDARVMLDGPPVEITASASQALGMALHELATNAAKYGALSIKSGRVIVSWSLLSDAAGKARFTLSWIESGGPLVAKPTRLGFGSTVTGSMIKMSLGCDAEVDFAPTGLVWRIDCPVAGLIAGSTPPAPRSNGAALKEQPAQASGRRRVLVVEDEPLIAMDIAHTLAEAGYDVIGPAGSVAEALSLIARSGCDAAVLDINLGAETAEPVARELIRRGTPYIATSGYTREQQPEIMRLAPLLGKPVKPGLLIAEIERSLGS